MTATEWRYREVCPDGACIGVIGDDGLCKICGRAAPNWGSDRTRGLGAAEPELESESKPDAEPDADDADGGDDGDGDAAELAAEAADVGTDDDDWTQRELCENGACVGVIGSDGTCTVCGSRRG
jgi:hypothetical protein